MTSQCTAKLALFVAIMSSHDDDDDDPTSLLLLLLLSLLPLPLASQPGFWSPPFSVMKKMWPNSPMFSCNREGWNCAAAEFQLLLPHKWSEAMGLDDLMAKKNLQVANILPANWRSYCCCCFYRGVGDDLRSWRQIQQQQQGYYSCKADVLLESVHCRREIFISISSAKTISSTLNLGW